MSILIRTFKKMDDQEGFTLLEVLIAMVIATFGLLSLALMQGYAIEGNSSGNKFTQATYLAQDMLENIKDGNVSNSFGFLDTDTSGNEPGTQLDAGGPDDIGEDGAPGRRFSRSWEVLAHTDWSRRINVTVSWTNDLGRDREVVLTSVSRGDGN